MSNDQFERRDPEQGEGARDVPRRESVGQAQIAYEKGDPSFARRETRDDRIYATDETDRVLAATREQSRRPANNRWEKALSVVAVILIVAGAGITYVRDVQQRKAVQFVALENCIRNNINSGLVNVSVENEQIAKNLYPIVNCKRFVLTGELVPLAEAEKKKYVALVSKGKAPIVKDGKVAGGRDYLLQGVNSVDDAGKPLPK